MALTKTHPLSVRLWGRQKNSLCLFHIVVRLDPSPPTPTTTKTVAATSVTSGTALTVSTLPDELLPRAMTTSATTLATALSALPVAVTTPTFLSFYGWLIYGHLVSFRQLLLVRLVVNVHHLLAYLSHKAYFFSICERGEGSNGRQLD